MPDTDGSLMTKHVAMIVLGGGFALLAVPYLVWPRLIWRMKTFGRRCEFADRGRLEPSGEFLDLTRAFGILALIIAGVLLWFGVAGALKDSKVETSRNTPAPSSGSLKDVMSRGGEYCTTGHITIRKVTGTRTPQC